MTNKAPRTQPEHIDASVVQTTGNAVNSLTDSIARWGVRAAEGTGLENRRTGFPYRGFESHPHRFVQALLEKREQVSRRTVERAESDSLGQTGSPAVYCSPVPLSCAGFTAVSLS